MNDFLNIATISGTHHLKGTVKANSIFDALDKIIGQKVMLENKFGVKKILTVKRAERMNAKRVLIDFDEIRTVSEAKLLNTYKIYIRRDLLGESSNDEYYNHDLIGMQVLEDNELLGEVTEIFTTAAHDIIVVNEGKEEIMIPDVDTFVKSIDFEERKIKVELIEGMR